MTLSVLTLNIWHNSGPWKDRVERIRSWIEQLDPDLIGFQEVLKGPRIDQVNEMLDGAGYHCDYSKAIDFWNDHSLAFGNAVAARWPITEREELVLPNAGDGEMRVALSVTLDAPVGPVSFTTTHLNWKFHHGAVRERQVVAVCDLALSHRPREGFPPIVVGDFNAAPESAEIRYVTGLQSIDGRSVYLRDAWAEAGEGSDGITWSNRNDYARPWLEPERRIDYIFVGPPRPNGLGRIERCRVVCNEAQAEVWPTDHFGVYAELQTEPRPDNRIGE
jgi:endonuclease/exonuclease/phosphatase family metal-dependent hydrolase